MFLPSMPSMPPSVIEVTASSSGGSYASVDVETYVNAGEGGGTSSVYIQTNDNGEVHTEHYTAPVSQNSGASIHVATSTGHAKAQVLLDSVASSSAPGRTTPAPIRAAGSIFSFMRRFLSWFGF